MNDPLDAIREIAPPVDPQPALLARVRSELMTTIDGSTTNTQPIGARKGGRRAGGRGVGMIAAAAAVVLMATTAVWAVTRHSDPADTTSVGCLSDDTTAIVDSVTGDPVVDCANEWRRANGSEPPAMAAYDDGKGGVAVIIVGDPVPAGYSALKPGTYQDTAVIELEAALQDVGSGLSADCYDAASARSKIRGELDRLGLDAWDVTVDSDREPNGSESCAAFALAPDQETVQIFGVGGGGGGGVDPYAPFATAVETSLTSQCLNVEEAAVLVRAIIADTVVEVGGTRIQLTEEAAESGVVVINSVVDPTASCTRATVTVGGRLDIILRGPNA